MLIPFSRLYLSDANVRKTRSEEDDIQLSADIEARGLLQNLLVTKSKKRGKFAVIAGGRRLRAIEMIVTRGACATLITQAPMPSGVWSRAVPCAAMTQSRC